MLESFLGRPAPNSARVFAFERDGAVVGLIGMYLDEYRYVAFGNFGDEVRRHPRALVKAYRILKEAARGKGLQIHAAAEETVPAAQGFLEHIGFRQDPAGHFVLEV